MELEYSDKNSRRSKVYIVVGVIVALLVAATVFVALQASGLTGDREVEMRDVVVATREIPVAQGDRGGRRRRPQRRRRPDERDRLHVARRGPRPRGRRPRRDRAARDPEHARVDDRGPDVLDPRARAGVRRERAGPARRVGDRRRGERRGGHARRRPARRPHRHDGDQPRGRHGDRSDRRDDTRQPSCPARRRRSRSRR